MKFKFLFPIILCSMLSDAYATTRLCCNNAAPLPDGTCGCYQGNPCCTGGVTITCSALNCVSDDWPSSTGSVYETRVARACKNNVCQATREYRCAAGYYGEPTSTSSGCSTCPRWSGNFTDAAHKTVVVSTSDAGNNKYVTNCYVPYYALVTSYKINYYDSLGKFTISAKCYAQ